MKSLVLVATAAAAVAAGCESSPTIVTPPDAAPSSPPFHAADAGFTIDTHPLLDEMYTWDDSTVLCSEPLDDLTGVDRPWLDIQATMATAAANHWVVIVHAHRPGVTVSIQALENIFTWADQYGLAYLTFDQLSPDQPHQAGIAFAFDDDDVSGWLSVLPILQAHHARVSFFITRYLDFTPTMLQGLGELAADGHAIEAHTVHHTDAITDVDQTGLAAYVQGEVVPSYQDLVTAGYAPTSFAYPFGDHTPAIDQAVLAVPGIVRVRTTPGGCGDPDDGGGD